MGCIQQETRDVSKTDEGRTGSLSSIVLINGVETRDLSLISRQAAEIGLKLRNNGIKELNNVSGVIVGCIDAERSNTYDLPPETEQYFSWSIRAPIMGTGESLRCPSILRMCFDYVSEGYTEIIFVPEDYTGVPLIPNKGYSSDFFSMEPQFGVVRVICEMGEDGTCTISEDDFVNEFVGNYRIINTGPGWVDYIDYADGVSINVLRRLKIDASALENVEIIGFGGLDKTGMSDYFVEENVLDLQASAVGITDVGLIRLMRAKELNSRIAFRITNPDFFQDGPKVYTMHITAEHGYCLDVANINLHLRG